MGFLAYPSFHDGRCGSRGIKIGMHGNSRADHLSEASGEGSRQKERITNGADYKACV